MIGTDGTNNVLSISEDTHENICVKFDLEQINSKILEILEWEIVGPTNSEGDWLSALVVAMRMLYITESISLEEYR